MDLDLAETLERIKFIEAEILRKNAELTDLNKELGERRAFLVANCPHPAEFLRDEPMEGIEDRRLETCTICGGVEIKEC